MDEAARENVLLQCVGYQTFAMLNSRRNLHTKYESEQYRYPPDFLRYRSRASTLEVQDSYLKSHCRFHNPERPSVWVQSNGLGN